MGEPWNQVTASRLFSWEEELTCQWLKPDQILSSRLGEPYDWNCRISPGAWKKRKPNNNLPCLSSPGPVRESSSLASVKLHRVSTSLFLGFDAISLSHRLLGSSFEIKFTTSFFQWPQYTADNTDLGSVSLGCRECIQYPHQDSVVSSPSGNVVYPPVCCDLGLW